VKLGLVLVGMVLAPCLGRAQSGLQFVPVNPSRVMDTRGNSGKTGEFGAPALSGNTSRDVRIPQSGCGIPDTAQAYSLNVAVVPPGPLIYLTLWPTGQPQPLVSTLNSFDGRVVANAAIVPAGMEGAVSAFAGIHYSSDAESGFRLGEDVVIVLQDWIQTFNEDVGGFQFTRLDGTPVKIQRG